MKITDGIYGITRLSSMFHRDPVGCTLWAMLKEKEIESVYDESVDPLHLERLECELLRRAVSIGLENIACFIKTGRINHYDNDLLFSKFVSQATGNDFDDWKDLEQDIESYVLMYDPKTDYEVTTWKLVEAYDEAYDAIFD